MRADQNHPTDLAGAPGIGADHLGRAAAPGAGNLQLDITEFGQKTLPIAAIAALGSVLGIKRVEMAAHRRGHPTFNDLRQGTARKGAITLAPPQAVRLHRLRDFKGHR